MRYLILSAALFCGALSVAHAADTVTVQRPVPYADGALVAGAVKRECKLTEQLPDFVREYASENHTDVVFAPQASASSPGRVLVMEIVDASSDGNAFIGHHKSVTVRGKLYQDGKEIGDFTGRRNSMGGAFGGFKGSCSVLGRTVKALGKDVAQWLVQPTQGSQLGDLQ